MVAARIPRQRNYIHPGLKDGCVQVELLGHSFFVSSGKVSEYPCDVVDITLCACFVCNGEAPLFQLLYQIGR